MNQHASELEFFGAQAEAWWSNEGAAAMLHRINPPRLQFISTSVNLNNLQVLDVGCGGGILTESLARLGAHVSGIDLAEPLIAVAKTHATAQKLNINYVCTSVESFAEENPACFDVITCMEMLEHVPDPASIIAAIAKLLKPGGYVFLSTINRSLLGFLKVIVAAEYLLQWLPRGTHHYGQFIRVEELTEVMRHYELLPFKLASLNFNPLLNTFDLLPKPGENYLLSGQKSI